jgi:hypothetical protein
MGTKPQISADLIVVGPVQMDFDECSTAVGLTPTRTWRSKVITLPIAEWGVGFDKQEYGSIDLALSELLDMVANHKERIRQFAALESYAVMVVCAVTVWEEPPLYEISPSHIRTLAELEAKFILHIQ